MFYTLSHLTLGPNSFRAITEKKSNYSLGFSRSMLWNALELNDQELGFQGPILFQTVPPLITTCVTLYLRHLTFANLPSLCFLKSKVRLTVVVLCALSRWVVSDSLWAHGLKPTRLLCPWSGLPCPPPGIKPKSPTSQADSFLTEPQGSPDGFPGYVMLTVVNISNLQR